MSSARSRLLKELKDAAKTREETGIDLQLEGDSLFSWRATFQVWEISLFPPPLSLSLSLCHQITNVARYSLIAMIYPLNS